MSAIDLDALEALAEAATPGPWGPPEARHFNDYQFGSCTDWYVSKPGIKFQSQADAAFIAAARSSVPMLIAEVRRLKRLVGEDD